MQNMQKDLKEKAISIKGKKYVLVSDRVKYFNAAYSNGVIKTKLIKYEDKQIIVKATVIPDIKNPERYFEDYSQEIEGQGYINKTSALENASTSAVGRALALMGIGVLDSIASADEMNKAENRESYNKQPRKQSQQQPQQRPDDKQWFNQPDLDKAMAQILEEKGEGKTNDEILKMIQMKYKVSKEMQEKIKNLK